MMVMSDGDVRWLVFNLKATEKTAQPSNKPFQPFQQQLSMAEVQHAQSQFYEKILKFNPGERTPEAKPPCLAFPVGPFRLRSDRILRSDRTQGLQQSSSPSLPASTTFTKKVGHAHSSSPLLPQLPSSFHFHQWCCTSLLHSLQKFIALGLSLI